MASFDPFLKTKTDREVRLIVTYSSPIKCIAKLALADDEEQDLSQFVLVQSPLDEKQVRVLELLMLEPFLLLRPFALLELFKPPVAKA